MDNQTVLAITSVLGALTTIIAAVQGYRTGLSRIKSLEATAVKELHNIVASEAERCYKHLKQCKVENQNQADAKLKWRTGYSIASAQLRNHGVKDHWVTYEDIESKSLSWLLDKRNKISNVK